MVKTDSCINEVIINDYLNGKLSGRKKEEVESHLAECPECLETLVFAYQAVNGCRKPKGAKIMKTKWKKNIWLIGAIIAFTLSFFFRDYFVQFLVAAILLGLKWIFDSTNARMLIMIYDAWRKGGEQEASKIFKNFNDRIVR